MRITLSAIKADIGSVGGHLRPSDELMDAVRTYVKENCNDLYIDSYINSTGDDIHILMSHTRGIFDEGIHKLAWDAFTHGTEIAKKQGLYGAGQDLLKDAFSGTVKGLGPGYAEIEFEEREAEQFLLIAMDKTSPGAFNLPVVLSFAYPDYCPGLLLNPEMKKGFKFTIMDVNYIEGDRIIELCAPEDLYDITSLTRDVNRFVIEKVNTRSGEPAAVLSTTRLHNIAGKYTGKDDPIAILRSQMNFPATGELSSPYLIAHYVPGNGRGSHNIPLMPVPLGTGISAYDGPAIATCAAFSMKNGKFTKPDDVFAHPVFEIGREKAREKLINMRDNRFTEPAMLPINELEYGGIKTNLKELDEKFTVREDIPKKRED